MTIIQRSARHNMLLSFVFFFIPMVVLNLWILEKGQLAKLRDPENIKWIVFSLVISILDFLLIFKVKRTGFYFIAAQMFGLFLFNVYMLFSVKNYALGFYALFILIVSSTYLFYLIIEMNNAYYHSGRRWFEGRPRLLPELSFEFLIEDKKVIANLSRLDEKGCFVTDFTNLTALPSINEAFLIIDIHKQPIRVNLMSVWKGSKGEIKGMGFAFLTQGSDEYKDLLDFLERVRSFGYAV